MPARPEVVALLTELNIPFYGRHGRLLTAAELELAASATAEDAEAVAAVVAEAAAENWEVQAAAAEVTGIPLADVEYILRRLPY